MFFHRCKITSFHHSQQSLKVVIFHPEVVRKAGGVKLEVRNRDLWFMGNKDSGDWTKPAKS